MVEPGFLGGGRCGGVFFSPKTADEKMCKISAISRALKNVHIPAAFSGAPGVPGLGFGVSAVGGRA